MRFDDLDPAPTGFGQCSICPYVKTGTANICYLCASQTMAELPEERCLTCDHPKGEEERCGNPVCNYEERYFDYVFAISLKSGELERAIHRYKFNDMHGWALIFGRVLAGYLREMSRVFSDYDVILGSPTFLGHGGREWDHIRRILKHAKKQLGSAWPIDTSEPRLIEKTGPTRRLSSVRTFPERRDITERELRPALRIPDAARTRGRKIVVFDDVFTGGLTLHEIARALVLEGGAEKVTGLVLARAQFRGGQ